MTLIQALASQSFGRRLAVGGLAVLAVVTLMVIPATNQSATQGALKSYESRLNDRVNAKSESLQVAFTRLDSDIRFLSATPPIQGIVRAAANGGYDAQEQSEFALWQRRLEAIFTAYLRTHPQARQVRYIGVANEGTELIRVDRHDDRLIVIRDQDLQAKGNRNYFLETIRRKPGEVYFSDIDLNREHGQVEVPHVPTVRVGVPVFDSAQTVFGMVVINWDASLLLDALHADDSAVNRSFVLNSRGDFIVHPDAAKAFAYEVGEPIRWDDEFKRVERDQSASDFDSLMSVSGPQGLMHVVQKRLNYDRGDPSRFVTVISGVGDQLIRAEVEQATLRALLILAAISGIVGIFLYLIVLAVARREEAGLKQAELAAIVSGSEDAIVGKTLAGVVTSWNIAAEKMFGYSAKEAIGQTVTDLLVPTDRADEESYVLERVGSGNTVAPFDTIRHRKDGSLIDVSVTVSPVRGVDGRIVGAAKIARDITEQKAVQAHILELNEGLEKSVLQRTKQLEASVSLQRAILENAGYAIIATDVDGLITLFNPAAEVMLGYAASEMVGKLSPAIFHLGDEVVKRAADLSAELGQLVEPGFDVFIAKARLGISDENEWTYVRKDGTQFPVALKVTALTNARGDISGYLGIAADRTARKKEERELVRAKEVADAASRAKGEFLANMSHEIRTPMNAVLGMIQLLQRTELNNRQADYVEKAGSAARSLLEIINDILDFSKIEAGRLVLDIQPFVVDDLMRDLATLLGTAVADKHLEILFRLGPDLPHELNGDSLRLKQILVNLAGNAVKFTESGEVVIEVSVLHLDSDDVRLKFSVKDTGIGMTQEQQKRIFKAFTQAEANTTRRFGGTGLGLVISQNLIHLMGGELELVSEAGKGSTFSFVVTLKSSTQKLEQAVRADPPELRDLRVLVVDDNDQARQIISEMARSLGWQADIASGGFEAAKLVAARKEAGQPYQVVFLDWFMPDLDGWKTAERIRELGDQSAVLPLVLMVTAHSREMLASRMDKDPTRIDGFLVKPVTPSDLLDAVAEALASSGEIAAPRIRRAMRGERLNGMRILVVEDNLINQQVAHDLLVDEGAQVEIAGGGLIALDCLSQSKEPFDIVLMDIQMPDIDGYAATRRIRSELGMTELPIVAMTANAMHSDRLAALAAGMNEHIGKPFDIEQVVSILLAQCAWEAGPVDEAGSVDHLLEVPALPPSPEGFSFEPALRRLGANKDLYARHAVSFEDKYRDEVDVIRASLQKGDKNTAQARLHTLKGVAATLGADALAQLASALEAALKADDAVDAQGPELVRLAGLLDEAASVLKQLGEHLQSEKTSENSDEVSSEKQNCGPIIALLEVLLSESNMRAIEVYAELRPLLDDQPTELVHALTEAVDELDFAMALEHLGKLKSLLGSEPA